MLNPVDVLAKAAGEVLVNAVTAEHIASVVRMEANTLMMFSYYFEFI